MDPTMTGSEHTVRRIDTTEQGTRTLAGGEQDERRPSRRTYNSSLPLNHAAQNFEPRTGNTRPNFQEQRPLNRDSGDVLNN